MTLLTTEETREENGLDEKQKTNRRERKESISMIANSYIYLSIISVTIG